MPQHAGLTGGSSSPSAPSMTELEVTDAAAEVDPRDTGSLKQLRSKILLGTICVSMLLDNVSMTSVNMAIPAISNELEVSQAQQTWLIASYTLAFGSFLLLAGVLADRYGKKLLFITGLLWISVFVLSCGFATSLISFAVLRAFQGLGASMTIPSAVGILTTFFSDGRERNLCLTIFGAAGALGFVVGLIWGGILTDVLSWRWVFWLNCPVAFATAVTAYFVLPNPKPHKNERRKSLDLIGAGVATSGLILLTFVLSSGEAYGWSTGYIIAILCVAVALLGAFPLVERIVKDPILPNEIWKRPGFAATWSVGFFVYCWWQTLILYNTYISQNIFELSALRTSLQFAPMGCFGAVVPYLVAVAINRNLFAIKTLLLSGLLLCFLSVLPVALMRVEHGFWASVFVSNVLGVSGISIVYNAASIALLASVPPQTKSLAAGAQNTGFQIGAGFGVAIVAAVVTSVQKTATSGDAQTVLLDSYQAGLWTTGGFCAIAFAISLFGVQGGSLDSGPSE